MSTMKFFFLVSIVFQLTNSFELFIRQSSDENASLLNLNSFKNRSYQISLFQTRTIIVKIKPEKLFLASGKIFSAFRLQVKAKDHQVIEIKKQSTGISTSFPSIELDPILFDDLFIGNQIFLRQIDFKLLKLVNWITFSTLIHPGRRIRCRIRPSKWTQYYRPYHHVNNGSHGPNVTVYGAPFYGTYRVSSIS